MLDIYTMYGNIRPGLDYGMHDMLEAMQTDVRTRWVKLMKALNSGTDQEDSKRT